MVKLANHRFHCDPKQALVFATPVELNGRSMVKFEMAVGSFTSDDLEITALKAWVADRQGLLAVPNFRFTTAKMDDRRYYALWISITVQSLGLTAEATEESIDFLYRSYNEALAPVRHLRTRKRIQDRRTSSREDNIEAILTELDQLVGLQPVKTKVRELAARQSVAQLRKKADLRVPEFSPHLVFTGNPGTGKTTIARQIGRIYQQMGLLKKGHVVETNRSNLVGGYVGQTALKTTEVCNSALGGVLFIDEAYSLTGKKPDFGQEAIETLLTFMEAHRGEFVVIVAGYPQEMSEFLESNPGLRSRFDLTIDFPDYDDSELVRIFRQLLQNHDYRLAGDALPALVSLVKSLPRGRSFGNAREVRRLFDQVVCNHAVAMMGKPDPSRLMLQTIPRQAIEMATVPREPGSTPSSAPAEPTVEPGSWPGYL